MLLISSSQEQRSQTLYESGITGTAEQAELGSQTTITEPLSTWKALFIKAAQEKKWFRDLLTKSWLKCKAKE